MAALVGGPVFDRDHGRDRGGVALRVGQFLCRSVDRRRFFTVGTQTWRRPFDPPRVRNCSLVTGTIVTTLVRSLGRGACPWVPSSRSIQASSPSHKVRDKAIKPTLELLSAVPTVVYGYFALLVVTPILQAIIPGVGGFSMLSARTGDGNHDHSLCQLA